MALQLASGRPPSLSADDLVRVKQELTQLGSGFESSLLEYPDLVATDGRQDFLHFFLYSLIVAPAVPLVEAFGLHTNWAFTLVNALLLSTAIFVVARHAPLVACVAGFVGPIIWWVDKAHTEAFLFAAVSIAAVTVREHPALALIVYALAGAQNAAIGATYPFFTALAWAATRDRTFTRRTWASAVIGGVIVAAPFIYTLVRLGRLSPMAEYAQRVIPLPASLAAFVIEPNIGLLPSAPVYGVVMILAVWMMFKAARLKAAVPFPAFWWWPAVIQVLLLLAWSQNPNANHGGTPGVNRWVLSLLALSLPWIADARQVLLAPGRQTLNIVIGVAGVMSAAAYVPARPENYREPTSLASRMWDAGLVHVTPAEVFAERTQGREPAFAPGHDGSCRVLLIAEQQSPVQCRPPVESLPSWCRGPAAMCYAITDGNSARYIRAPANGFFYRAAEPSWPAGGPLAGAMHRVLREADPNERVWRVENPRRWRERLAGADIGVVLSTADASVIYIPRLTEAARAAMIATGMTIVPLLTGGSSNAAPLSNLAVVVPR